MSKQLKTLLPLLAALLIVVVGTAVRVHNVVKLAFFDIDMSRDVLAVNHIVRFGEQHFAIPDSAGSANTLKNSWLYFYILIPLYVVGGTPESLLTTLNILAGLNIFIFYLVGRRLHGNWAGLIAAAFYGLNIFYVDMTRDIWQPFVLAVFLPVGFYWLLRSWQEKSATFFIVTILWFGCTVHIHTSVVSFAAPLLAYFVGMNVYFWPRRRRVVWASIAALLAAVSFWLFASRQFDGVNNLLGFVSPLLSRVPQLLHGVATRQPEGFPTLGVNPPWVAWLLGVCTVLLGGKYVTSLKHLSVKQRREALPMHLFFLVSVGSFGATYLLMPLKYYYFFPYFFLFAWLFSYVVAATKSSWFCAVVLITVICLSLPTNTWHLKGLENWGDNDMEQKRLVAKLILDDAYDQKKAASQITFISWVNYGSSPFLSDGHAYWYFLEQYSQQQLVKLLRLNAFPILLHRPTLTYVICESGQIYETESITEGEPFHCLAKAQYEIEMTPPSHSCLPAEFQELSTVWVEPLWKYRIFRVVVK